MYLLLVLILLGHLVTYLARQLQEGRVWNVCIIVVYLPVPEWNYNLWRLTSMDMLVMALSGVLNESPTFLLSKRENHCTLKIWIWWADQHHSLHSTMQSVLTVVNLSPRLMRKVIFLRIQYEACHLSLSIVQVNKSMTYQRVFVWGFAVAEGAAPSYWMYWAGIWSWRMRLLLYHGCLYISEFLCRGLTQYLCSLFLDAYAFSKFQERTSGLWSYGSFVEPYLHNTRHP